MFGRFSEPMKKLLVVPPILAGIGVFIFLVQTRQAPQRMELQEAAREMQLRLAAVYAREDWAISHEEITSWRSLLARIDGAQGEGE